MLRISLFVACQQKRKGSVEALGLTARLYERRNPALHILRAAGVDVALFKFRDERIALPPVTRWDDIDMTRKAKMRTFSKFFVKKKVLDIVASQRESARTKAMKAKSCKGLHSKNHKNFSRTFSKTTFSQQLSFF